MSGFNNPVVGALKLIRRAIQSPNYAAGSTGWSINDDGSAEFNGLTVRGKIIVQSSTQGIFVYSGTPTSGNLVASIASAGGLDPYGNSYYPGMVSYAGDGSQVRLQAGQVDFYNASYAADGFMGTVPQPTAPASSPRLYLSSPTNNQPPGSGNYAQVNLYGESQDGTSGPLVDISGYSSATQSRVSVPVNINGDLTVTGIGQVRYATATGGQAVTNNSTLQDDNVLTMSVTAGAVYDIEIVAYFHSNNAAAALLTSWSVPTGSTGLKACIGATNVAAGYTSTSQTQSRYTGRTPTTNATYQLDGSGTSQAVIERCALTAGANGSVTFRWAQNTATAGATTQRDSSSFIKVTKIA